GIHSTQPGAEFYITIYGSIAQSESENISANVKFGKAQSAREGNVAFHYRPFTKIQHTKTVCCIFVCGAEREKIRGNRVSARAPSENGKGKEKYLFL
ncbi:MAG: hypothetical protein IJY63_01160, partial [Clostridia bacterium]|nr:hypothetical protein [Clostridia bacterium]